MNMAWFSNYAKKKLKAPHKTVLENRDFLVYFKLTYYFLTDFMIGTHLSVEVYFTNQDNAVWERKLLQQEPDPIDIFLMNRKN